MSLSKQINESKASVQQMAILTGIPADRIYKWKQGKADPEDASDIEKMESLFQSISNLSKNEIKLLVAKKTVEPNLNKRKSKKVPIIGEAAAGTDEEMIYTDMDNHYQDQYIDVGDLLSDSEAAFVVYGNSMTPAYPSGCILGIRRNYDRFIQPGETYLIVTKSNRVFKRLYYNDDNTKLICYSDNTMMYETGPRKGHYAYPPFEIDIEKDIVQIFDVIGMIKRNRPTAIIQRQK